MSWTFFRFLSFSQHLAEKEMSIFFRKHYFFHRNLKRSYCCRLPKPTTEPQILSSVFYKVNNGEKRELNILLWVVLFIGDCSYKNFIEKPTLLKVQSADSRDSIQKWNWHERCHLNNLKSLGSVRNGEGNLKHKFTLLVT